MSFRCAPATLERLEWPRLVEWLAQQAATARGAEACRGELFSPTREGARERLAETSEARALLDSGAAIPFGGVADLRPLLAQLERGATPSAEALAQLRATLEGARHAGVFLGGQRELAQRLAALADTLPDLRALERELAAAIAPEGGVREDASRELARALRAQRDCERDVERRMAACLRDPEIAPYLQDHYVTSRDERPVLPVRADARRRVRGIVHDVSSSGTTVFIEPESVVEPGNRLRLARTDVTREVERVLQRLADAARREAHAIAAQGETLEQLDVIWARGRLSQRTEAVAPDVSADAPLALRGLRHPLLLLEGGLEPEQVIANDALLPAPTLALVISGPNAGGKTVFAKALALAVLSVRAGLHVCCDEGSSVPVLDAVFADIGDEQDLRSGLSTFSARMSNLAQVAEEADSRTLVVVDEIGEGTEPGEGAALAQAILEALVERGSFVLATTHFNRLKEIAASDPRFANAAADFDPATLLPTFRIRLGVPGSSGAMWVAERMGLARSIVERGRALLDGEDRKLESLVRSLSELRQELESERSTALEQRAQSESLREEYETRLASLRAARGKALDALSAELEGAFRAAREEVASVMRALQRREGPDGRAASRAERKLEHIREHSEALVEQAHEPLRDAPPAVDLAALVPGVELALEGFRGSATLLEPPDRRGRLQVRMGAARLSVPASSVRAVLGAPQPSRVGRGGVHVERVEPASAPGPVCDLRGLRVDEALERADAHLHGALGTSLPSITFIHGHGSGALRSAVRDWLSSLPEVGDFAPGAQEKGGNGVTVVRLDR